jgi:hypothetical protein
MIPVKHCSKMRGNLLINNDVDLMHSYALSELQKDVENELQGVPEAERDALRTKFAIFVVHNKLKPKHAGLPPDVP